MTGIAGVLLAGGLARRMGGGDKCLRPLAGETLLHRVIERAAPQVSPLILNANGDAARFAAYGLPVVADVVAGHAGPLAGILTALDWAAARARLPPGGELRHRCALPAARSGGAAGRGPHGRRRGARLRRLGRPGASGVRPLAGGAPRRPADGPGGARRAQDRPLDRAPRTGRGALPLRPRRPLLQRQPHGRPGRGRAPDRASTAPPSDGTPGAGAACVRRSVRPDPCAATPRRGRRRGRAAAGRRGRDRCRPADRARRACRYRAAAAAREGCAR